MSVNWMRCFGQIPLGAVAVGHDKDGSSLYAGRAPHEGDVLPAKVKPDQQLAYVSWGGVEHPKQDYEIMVSHNVSWQSTRDGFIPARAVVVGQTAGGEPLYMGRAYYDDTLTPGKVQPSHGCLYIPYAGTEVPVREYEIMVVNVAPTPAFYPRIDRNDAGSNTVAAVYPRTDRNDAGSNTVAAFVFVCFVLMCFGFTAFMMR